MNITIQCDLGEPHGPLSPREMEVLYHVGSGQENKEIAKVLGISHQTIKNHITMILRKIGVENRTEAVLYGLFHQWFTIVDLEVDKVEDEYAS